ncbi:effector-associated domain EAD1-containing protein [Frankia tisae]|uniref:effector-associated domain EAD1-containing protein n=1 Tax=Frankia tisae TaxID=2950104 RepID=UPI003557CF74
MCHCIRKRSRSTRRSSTSLLAGDLRTVVGSHSPDRRPVNGRWYTTCFARLALAMVVALICAIAVPNRWPGAGAVLRPIGVGVAVGTVMSTIAITELRVRPRPDGLVVAVAALLGAGFGVPLARSRGFGPGVPSLLPETAGALILSFLISLFLARFPGKKVVAGNTDGDTDGGVRQEEPAIDTTASSTTNSASDPQPDWSMEFQHVGRSVKSTTDQQIKELARAFYTPALADLVLVRADLARENRPYWNNETPEQYWREIYHLVESGAIEGGWSRILNAAHAERPGNRYFV